MIVGQGFPVRQLAYLEFRREPRDFFEQTLRIGSAGGNDDEGAAGVAGRQFGQCQRIGGTGMGRQVDAQARLGQGGKGQQGLGGGHGATGQRQGLRL